MPLCNSCTAIRYDDLFSDTALPFKSAATELIDSAPICELCALFLSQAGAEDISRLAHPLYVAGGCYMEDDDRGRSYFARYLENLDLYAGRPERYTGQKMSNITPGIAPPLDRIASLAVSCDRDAPPFLTDRIRNRPVGPADDTVRVQEWLARCKDTHIACETAKGLKADDMPTRLVDVSSMDAGGAPVLVEGVPAVVDYLALSHRWGGSKIAQTTSTNLQEHKQGIPVQSLNRTFQDAITAARKLGYRYIWIDSLCILQDSREDWTREASRMALVYQNADITLSAACATSGDTGLFQSREGQTSSVKVPCSRLRDELDPPPIPNCYFTVRKKERRDYTFTKEVAEGPLNTRAWTLQERCLSRRIVHYARTQLYWECQTSIRVESLGSNIIPGPRERSERFGDMGGALQDGFLKHLLSSASIGRAPDMDLERQKININAYSAWYYLLSDYSGRDLTVGSDKLPAISGVARVFAEHRNDTYLAGLWKGDLPSGLLWRYATARLGFQRPLSSSPRAPSWSWACWDGAIITEMDWDGRVEIEDITASVQLVGTDPFGAVKSGSLRFRGPLAPIHKLSQITMPAQQTFGLVDANVQLCDAAGAVFGNGYADSYAEVADTSSLIFCLMVVSVFVGFSPFSLQVLNAKGKWAWCLMLRETADQQVYERVGIAQVHQSAFSGPKSAITIV